jgi:kinesin family protein 18/19
LLFDQHSTQEQVFEKTTKPLVKPVLNGYNSTVFAYGATGAGKTHTMIGNAEEPGVMYHTMNEIFYQVEKRKKINLKYKVKVSFLEIYNETIRDLIVPSNEILDLREDANKGIKVAGLSEIEVNSAEEILDLLYQGNNNRV